VSNDELYDLLKLAERSPLEGMDEATDWDGTESPESSGGHGTSVWQPTPGAPPAAQTLGGAPACDQPALTVREKARLKRQADIVRKKQGRKDRKVLLDILVELEATAQGGNVKLRPRDRKLHAVLERVTKRLRAMAAERPSEPATGAVPRELVVAGMMGARSFGTLYVCVEDWVVRSSNMAMELLCPYVMLRGYVGLELVAMVHPNDHLQLELLQKEQVHSFQDGDTLTLSVRMLRACEDRGTLVMAWRRQALEVARVARDEEHGGKLHVLFTCVLEADSVAPLTFDDSDRRLFQEIAERVSGTFILDPHRTTASMDELSQTMSKVGFTDRSEASPASDLVSRLSRIVGLPVGIPQLLAYCKNGLSGAASALNHLLRTHALWGLAPDGMPWFQMSMGLQAFGVASGYHTFFFKSMSSRPHSMGLGADIAGVFKPLECVAAVEGGAAIGGVFMSIEKSPGEAQGQSRRIARVGQSVFTYDAENQAVVERTWLNFHSKSAHGALPKRTDINSMRTGPPDQGLLKKFLAFGAERVSPPLPEFCS